jgi:hypothetical protein
MNETREVKGDFNRFWEVQETGMKNNNSMIITASICGRIWKQRLFPKQIKELSQYR